MSMLPFQRAVPSRSNFEGGLYGSVPTPPGPSHREAMVPFFRGRRLNRNGHALLACLTALLIPFTPTLSAAEILDFEDLQSTFMFLGGGQNIGTFYNGVNLGSNITGLDLTGSTAFPVHSGSIAVWDPTDLVATIAFDDPQQVVGVWYTSFDFLTLTAFDSAGTVLSSLEALPNTDGTTGASDFVSLAAPDISSVTLSGAPGSYVFDDLTFSAGVTNATPELGNFWVVLSIAILFTARAWHYSGRTRPTTSRQR